MTSNQNKEVQCLHVRQLRASLMMRDVCMLSKHNRAQSSLQTETDVRWTSVETHFLHRPRRYSDASPAEITGA